MSYYIDTTKKSDTYIARPGADVGDRAYFATAPLWGDEYAHVLRYGSKFETVGGRVHTQSYPRVAVGLPIVLEGDGKDGLMFDIELAKLKVMFDEGIELELSEDNGATTVSVRPDPSKDPIDMKFSDKYQKRVLHGTIYLIRA